jgi:uncharacterized membrane protein YphA (DoxX/SURF4 family)
MAKKRTVSKSRGPTTTNKIAWRLNLDTLFVLQILVAIFLVSLGLMGLVDYDSGWSQLHRDIDRAFGVIINPLTVIVAVVELVAGLLLLATLFVPVRTRWLYWTTLVIAITWAAWIVLDLFVNHIFEPSFLAWLNQLADALVMFGALWLINRKYA